MAADAGQLSERESGTANESRNLPWVTKSRTLVVLYIGCLLGVVGSAALLGYSAWFRNVMPLPNAAFLMTVIVLTGTSFVLFVRSIETEQRLSIESHWGGLGGGLGGWQVSRSLTYLCITAALALLLWGAMPPYPGPAALGYLGERYRAAIQEAQKDIKQLKISVSGGKLHLSGTADQTAINNVWSEIKKANPAYDDIEANFEIEKTTPNSPPTQPPK